MTTWMRDEGYSCEETARRGDFAAVIAPPEYTDDGRYGIQIYDEADEEAIDAGEYYTMIDGLPGREAAKRVAAAILEELAAARA